MEDKKAELTELIIKINTLSYSDRLELLTNWCFNCAAPTPNHTKCYCHEDEEC